MKIHYFQRYHQKENVVTGNTMLLLQRLFSHSPTKYYNFLEEIVNANAETVIELQTKIKGGSVPDATIRQPSINIVVEVKLNDSFDIPQLVSHLKSFGTEEYQVLLTLCPVDKPRTLNKVVLEREIENYNLANKTHIVCKHITFEAIVNKISNLIGPTDTDMFEVLNDFKLYCVEEELIPHIWMKVRAVGTTIKDNVELGLYYHAHDRPHMDGHKFIGLYSEKEVRYVGEIVCKVVYDDVTKVFTPDHDYVDYYKKNKIIIETNIKEAVKRSFEYDYNLHIVPHRFFIVEKFEPSHYIKSSSGGLFGERSIDLTVFAKAKETDKAIDIAKKLNGHTWL